MYGMRSDGKEFMPKKSTKKNMTLVESSKYSLLSASQFCEK